MEDVLAEFADLDFAFICIFSISNTSFFQSACFLWGVLGVVVGGDGFLKSSFY